MLPTIVLYDSFSVLVPDEPQLIQLACIQLLGINSLCILLQKLQYDFPFCLKLFNAPCSIGRRGGGQRNSLMLRIRENILIIKLFCRAAVDKNLLDF